MEYTLTGDLTGGGSATINTTITGLKGKPLPELSEGALVYSGGNWAFGASGGGELSGSEISITGATTATIGRFHRCSGTTTDYTVTLPTTVGNAGKQIAFLMDSGLTKLVTLQANGSETIDGQNTRILWANESCVLRVNDAGTKWEKIGGKTIPMICHLKLDADTSAIAVNTLTNIPCKTFRAELSNCPSSMYNLTTGRVVFRRPGKYNITYEMTAGRGNTSVCDVAICPFVNGAQYSAVFSAKQASMWTHITTSLTPTVVSGWEVAFYIFYNGGSGLYVSETGAGTFMQVNEITSW